MNGEIKKCAEMEEDDNTTYYNFWDTMKAITRGNFISLQAYLKKQEKFQVNNLKLPLELEEEKQKQPKISRRKEIIKIRAELNKIENKKTMQKLIQQASSLKRLIKLTTPWLDSLKIKGNKRLI